jgi:hypothetical protein
MLEAVSQSLVDLYGVIDLLSPWYTFDYTEYYHAEMGGPLHRRVMAFKDLVEQDQLAGIKHATNEVEQRYAVDGRRRVNIDPGILLYERFVLATGKNYAHRIYIGQQIYADLTLVFQQGGYQVLPWTYPDYASDEIRAFLLKIRRQYAEDLSGPNR